MGCLNYMYNCFKNLKTSFQNYQARASGYEAHQNVSSGNDSEPKYPPALMETVANSIADTFACGVFALANLICYEKKYFCQKKTISFNAYYIDEYDIKNDEDDDDNEYYFVNEYDLEDEDYDSDDDINDADLLAAYIEEYGADDDEEYDTCVLSEDEDDTQYPPAKTLDNAWGFINSGDLSVEFKDTTLAPRGPKKAIDFPRLILAQAKKDFFKRLASKPKQNLSRQNKMMAKLSPKPKRDFSA
ncbi:hypothetical protein HPULCUR_007718 [Helicostylum pulchrum]|uniref:Uncharacterized protein n=1 Tax=Helicostylum pulchrum TaxID=562976 RepID=A0ABP9Y6A2_9FUNG